MSGSPATPAGSPSGRDQGGVKGRRTHPLSPLVSAWLGLVALVFFVGQQLVEDGFSPQSLRELVSGGPVVPLIAVAVVLASILLGFLGWWSRRFHLTEDALAIESHFIWHESKRLLFRKVQSVDIRQPFAARLLGLCVLRVEIGGEGNEELRYLRRGEAEQLQRDLLGRAQRAGTTHPAPTQLAPATPNAPSTPGTPSTPAIPGGSPSPDLSAIDLAPAGQMPLQQPGRLVAEVGLGNLLIGTFTDGAFLFPLATIGIASLVWLVFDVSTWYIIAPVALGLAGHLFKRILKEGRFRVEDVPEGLRISCGLTDLASATTPADRIQAFSFEQPMLARPFGLWRVKVGILGNESADDTIGDVALAIGTWQQAMDVMHAVWPGVDLDAIAMQGVPERARWFLWWGQKRRRWGMDDQVAVSQRGLLGTTISVLDHPRAQALTLEQGPLDRLVGLANVTFNLSSSSVSLDFSHLDPAVAAHIMASQPALARRVRDHRSTARTSLAHPRAQFPDQPLTDQPGAPTSLPC